MMCLNLGANQGRCHVGSVSVFGMFDLAVCETEPEMVSGV